MYAGVRKLGSEESRNLLLTGRNTCPRVLTMTNTETTTNQRVEANGKQYLLRRRTDGTFALFARVGKKWSGGVIYAADRVVVAEATGIPADRIV